jgi:predicted nucleic acid-binding protein
MAILDTNVLIRYLTNDDEGQSARAIAFLEEIEARRRTVILTEAVLAETVQVLAAPWLYAVDRETIRTRLLAVLRMPNLTLANKNIYYEALDLYVRYSRLSFVDALCVAHAQHSDDKTVISFDRDFRNLPGLQWEQP